MQTGQRFVFMTWILTFSMWSASHVDSIGIHVLSFPCPDLMSDHPPCISHIELASHDLLENFIRTAHRAIKGCSMWLRILCWTPSPSHSCCWVEKPWTLQVRVALIGKSPMRIQACDDGRSRISAHILCNGLPCFVPIPIFLPLPVFHFIVTYCSVKALFSLKAHSPSRR